MASTFWPRLQALPHDSLALSLAPACLYEIHVSIQQILIGLGTVGAAKPGQGPLSITSGGPF